ncbi:MAG: twin-arginine translocase subunit TatC [Prevotella sp.]|nr:twin-arginine translocase subunit TatC [Prevotella sp.]
MTDGQGTFWEHLDELRTVILRSLCVVAVLAVVAFCLKDSLFAVVLAPRSSDFFVYRLMHAEPFSLHLMNTGLTEQFMTHMRDAVYAGLLFGLPYVLYQLMRFVSPGLYQSERKVALRVVVASYVMFAVGTLVCYFVIFPLTVRFLGTYQVSPDVDNMLTLRSYVDTLISMNLVMGVVFELPVVCAILSQMGFVNRRLMRYYRRHALVAILVVAAVITPTTDVFTLLIVALPIWLLYEASILVVKV